MTAPITTDAAPATDGGGASSGQAPGTTTSTSSPAGPGDTGTGTTDQGDAPRGRRAPTERVRSATREDDAPTDHHDTDAGDGDGDGGDDKKAGKAVKAGDWNIDDLPPGAQKLISDLRKENGNRRTEAGEAKKRAEQAEGKAKAGDERFASATEAFMRALGLTPEPDEPERSPEELVGELTTKYQQKTIELAVYRAATAAGGDPEALLDSRGFLAKAHALDPTADDFDEAIADAIGDAVDANPKLRAAPAYEPPATPSGGDFGGGPAEPLGPDEWSVDDFRRNRNNGRGNTP